jgi:hypothetical protein
MTRWGMKKSRVPKEESPSRLIDARIRELQDWRGKRLSQIRALIKEVDPEVVEEIKWRKPSNPAGVPVWSHDGIICTGQPFKDNVRVTFLKGALLKDPKGLFNADLKGNKMRAIVIHEQDVIDENTFKGLVKAAVALNTSTSKKTG